MIENFFLKKCEKSGQYIVEERACGFVKKGQRSKSMQVLRPYLTKKSLSLPMKEVHKTAKETQLHLELCLWLTE